MGTSAMRRVTAWGAAAAALTLASPVAAQSLSADLFGGRPMKPPVVGRYTAAQGDSFVLDHAGATLLLKFDDRTEVWALRPTPGPGGGTLYRNDVGQPMVRATRLGGLTLFTPDRPTGTPAAYTSSSGPLRGRSLSPGSLLRELAQASTRASRAVRRLLPFEAPDIVPGTEPLIADAAHLAADGVVAAAATPAGRRGLAKLRRVRVTQGADAQAVVQGPTLDIVIAPRRGLGGRPSSARAALAIQAAD